MKIPGSIGHDRVSIACLRIGQANFRRLNGSSRGVKDLASQGPGGGGLTMDDVERTAASARVVSRVDQGGGRLWSVRFQLASISSPQRRSKGAV